MSSSQKTVIAEVLSFFTNPIFVLIAAIAYIAHLFADDPGDFVNWSLIGVGLLIAPALLFASYDWYKDRKIDIDISQRKERFVPMLLATLGAFIGSYLVNTRASNESLLLVGYVLVALLMALTIVTFVWKISLHTSTLSAAIMLLTIFKGPAYVFWIIIVIPVAWARIYLKQHTLSQVTAGSLFGVGITFVAWLIFRA